MVVGRANLVMIPMGAHGVLLYYYFACMYRSHQLVSTEHPLLFPTPSRIPRPIHRPLYMASQPILTGIELLPNHALAGQRTAYLLAHLSNGSVGIEMLADAPGGGQHRRVLYGRVSEMTMKYSGC
jgi:hypothetical protein